MHKGNVHCSERQRRRAGLPLVALAAAILIPALPLLVFESVGISTVDAPSHIRWLHGFQRGLAHGSWMPGWSDETFAGFGAYPLMIYGRASYYLLAPFVWLTGNAWSALRLGVPVTFVLSAWLAYRAGRLFFDRPGAVLVAVCYVLGPYVIFVPYSQFGITEHGAQVFIPWAVARLVLLLRRPSHLRFALFALAYGLVVFSHLIAAFALGGTLLAIAFAGWGSVSRLRSIGLTLGGVVAALALTAFYWPFAMLGGGSSAVVKQRYAEVYAQAHFAFGPDNWLIPDTATPLCYLAAAVLCVAVLMLRRTSGGALDEHRRLWWALAVLIVVTVAFESPLARPLWDRSSFLQQIQRPYRFHSALQLPAVLLLVAVWTGLGNGAATRRWRVGWRWLAGGVLAANLALGAAIPWYLYLSAERTVAALPEFDPRGNDWRYVAPPTANVEGVMADEADTNWRLRGQGVTDVHILEWRPERRLVRFTASGGPVDVRTFWSSGWAVSLDGQSAAARAADPYGQIRFQAPPGTHLVSLTYAWPARCRFGAGASIVAALACFVWPLCRTRRTAPCPGGIRCAPATP